MADERPERPSDLFPSAAPLLLVHLMNRGLPARYRMSEMAIIIVMERYRRFTKRDLLKHVRKAWASLGQSRPRGWTMPPLSETRDRIERFVPACINLFGEIKAGKLSNEREIAERIGAIARR